MTDAKQWCYTAYYDIENPVIPDELVHYRIEGKEICPTTQRPHIQGYVWLKKKTLLSGLKKIHSTAEFAKIKGTPYENFVYCSKDNNFTEIGPRPKEPKDQENPYNEALQADTLEEAIRLVKEKRPRDYCLHGESIERNLKRARITPFKHKYTVFTLPFYDTQKTMLFTGPSNIGKTHFATAHFKRPLLVSHIDKLKQLTNDHDGIVFDDMSFTHWPIESVIHLLDQELDRDINVRYGTVYIPSNTPKIFTHNTTNPFYKLDADPAQIEAIERRLNRVNFYNKIF